MRRFTNHEIAFDVPEDWTDASTTKFTFPECSADVSLTYIGGARGMPLEVCAYVLQCQVRNAYQDVELVRRHIEPGRWVELVVAWSEDGAQVCAVVRAMIVGDQIWKLVARTPKSAVEETRLVVARTMASFATCE